MPATQLDHPDLGTFIGQQSDGVQQYLGIQYATLRNRLAEPELRTYYESPIDAAKYAPAAYQPPSGFDNEVNLFIQKPLPNPEMTHSDVDCLNLNITVPTLKQGENLADRKLPVFVWIHGGGFVLGANSWPHYDHAKLVKLASEGGVPVIGVGINFRLGLPGLLNSSELRDAGYKGNNLLRDQRVAFAWIKRYIGGFGGDSDRITAIGESSGAMAVTLHLLSPTPLFNRAVATGGTFLLRKPLPAAAHEGIYQTAIAALGLDKLASEERINALLTKPMDEIIATLPPSVAFSAVVDNELIKSEVSYASVGSKDVTKMPGKEWLDALMVGDCQFDASVLTFLLAHLTPTAPNFPSILKPLLPIGAANRLLSLYNFSAANTPEQYFKAVINYINDVGYYLSTLTFATAFASRSPTSQQKGPGADVAFFFNHHNPWPGPFQGTASHVLDVAFLFQNYNHLVSEKQRLGAEAFGLDVCRFVAGEVLVDGDKRAVVYGDEGKGMLDINAKETGRNVELVRIMEEEGVGADLLMEVFDKFVMGGG